jgi:hypothetical protein
VRPAGRHAPDGRGGPGTTTAQRPPARPSVPGPHEGIHMAAAHTPAKHVLVASVSPPV